MNTHSITRRQWITSTTVMGCSLALPSRSDSVLLGANAGSLDESLIAAQYYPWFTFAKRAGADQFTSEQAIQATQESGIRGFEGIAKDAEEMTRITLAARHSGLELKSVYSNLRLHDRNVADSEVAKGIEIARVASSAELTLFIVNPEPIRWGGPEDKSDEELNLQLRMLESLAQEVRSLGMMLALHNHDAELRQDGRELHYMLDASDPALVNYCFDLHWIFRGRGNSMLAVKEMWRMYADRVVELHLRQSQNGFFTQVLGDGDIDYRWMAEQWQQIDRRPLLVLEQAIEEQTQVTLSPREAHANSLAYAEEVFLGRA